MSSPKTTYAYTAIGTYDAHGGPFPGAVKEKGDTATPTRPGRYVISKIGKYTNNESFYWHSRIEWGTPLRRFNGKMEIKINGGWTSLLKYIHESYTEESLFEHLKKQYEDYKFMDDEVMVSMSTDPDFTADLPSTWIFNDFGSVTVFYFKDLNGDYQLNGKEKVLTDHLHTTPRDEFHKNKGTHFDLVESHGCIHIRPDDIGLFIKHHYIEKGSVIEIHDYSVSNFQSMFLSDKGKPPFELHFYPGVPRKSRENGLLMLSGIMVVYTVMQISF